MMTTTLIPFMHADFDRYDAIETMVFDIFAADEPTQGFEDVVAFAASIGVEFTEWNWISLGIDFDEI